MKPSGHPPKSVSWQLSQVCQMSLDFWVDQMEMAGDMQFCDVSEARASKASVEFWVRFAFNGGRIVWHPLLSNLLLVALANSFLTSV